MPVPPPRPYVARGSGSPMNSLGSMSDRPKAALASLAKRRGIRGWDSMNKDDLVKALSRGTNPAKSKVSAKPTKPAPPARAVVKAANKVTAKRPAKLAAKPSAKSAAKIPQIAKSGSVVKPAVNGHHRA